MKYTIAIKDEVVAHVVDAELAEAVRQRVEHLRGCNAYTLERVKPGKFRCAQHPNEQQWPMGHWLAILR